MKSGFLSRRKYLDPRKLVAKAQESGLGKRTSSEYKENIDVNVVPITKKIHFSHEKSADSTTFNDFFDILNPFSKENRKWSSFTNSKSDYEV